MMMIQLVITATTTVTTTIVTYCAGEEEALRAQPEFDVEAMEERAGVAAAQDYNGFSWQQIMETGQQWRDYGYPEDQVSSLKSHGCIECMETRFPWCLCPLTPAPRPTHLSCFWVHAPILPYM